MPYIVIFDSIRRRQRPGSGPVVVFVRIRAIVMVNARVGSRLNALTIMHLP